MVDDDDYDEEKLRTLQIVTSIISQKKEFEKDPANRTYIYFTERENFGTSDCLKKAW